MSEKVFVFPLEEIEDMICNNEGICLACGAIRDSVEPDAEGYRCYECEEDAVVGIETAIILGRIGVEEDEM